MCVIFGADHAGYEIKRLLIEHLDSIGYPHIDIGTHDITSVDYPDYAHRVCEVLIERGRGYYGVLVCGTGIGMSIVANRYEGIRCALATDVIMAAAAREHNDANILALGARIVAAPASIAILNIFLSRAYVGGRHDRRLEKLSPLVRATRQVHETGSSRCS